MQSVLGSFGASHAALRSPPFAAVSLRPPSACRPLLGSSAQRCLYSCPAQLARMRIIAFAAQVFGARSAWPTMRSSEPVPGPMSWQRTFASSPPSLQRHQRHLPLPPPAAVHQRRFGTSSDDEGSSRGSQVSSGNSAGTSARSGSAPDRSTLFAHPTLWKSVMICTACSASASHSDHHSKASRRTPGVFANPFCLSQFLQFLRQRAAQSHCFQMSTPHTAALSCQIANRAQNTSLVCGPRTPRLFVWAGWLIAQLALRAFLQR